MKKDTKRLKKEISELLRQAGETDEREDHLYGKDRRGDELPEEITRRETRLARIKEAKRALEQEAKEQAEQEAANRIPSRPRCLMPRVASRL